MSKSNEPKATTARPDDVHAAAEKARNGKGDAADQAEALRAEIEQTRAEMGDTAAALIEKMDVPSRVKSAAAEKKAQLTEAAMDKKNQLTEVAAEKKNQLTDAVAEKKAQLAKAATEKKAQLTDAATEKKAQFTDTATDGKDRLAQAAAEKAGHLAETAKAKLIGTPNDPTADSEPNRLKQMAADAAGSIAAKAEAVTDSIRESRSQTDDTGTTHAGSASVTAKPGTPADPRAQARQESAETRTHLAETAAEAAERATTAIGTLPSRASEAIGALRDRALSTDPDHPTRRRQQYALIGAALAVAAVAAVLIRRLR
ncbi:hypothetical protein Q0Z83_058570 [Actinoplanes sichuanensis]|nr:hypothetical protein Q0Z83_058570 [Actinoplanes sichuanensis]